MEKYLWLVFVLILAFLLLQPNNRVGEVINSISKVNVDTILALQGRGQGAPR